jgi:hypothetical protein
MRKLNSILDTRYSILDTRYSILDTRYSILLFLLIILTFSNSAFAEKDYALKKCKVEYIQLDLITGQEIIYEEISSDFRDANYCDEGLERLFKKLYKWTDEKNTNIITKINEFRCKVKDVIEFSFFKLFYSKWSRYRKCETYIQKLSAYLVDEYPNKIGADVYKSFKSNR